MDRSTVGPLDALERSTKKNKNCILLLANRLPTDKTNSQGLNFTFYLLGYIE